MTASMHLRAGSSHPRANTLGLADALNNLLADSFALYVKTKNFHWHVSGPHFRDYHLMLDEQAADILGTVDVMAERVRKIGYPTLRSISDIARRQRIRDSNDEGVRAADMLAELRTDTLALVEAYRDAKKLADDVSDIASSAAIDGWIYGAEHRAWVLLETSRGN